MRRIQLFNVTPALPAELRFLEELPYNLWWSWSMDAIDLFRRIDPELWTETGHNPFFFFSRLPQERFEALVNDDGFMSHYRSVQARFEKEVLLSNTGEEWSAPPDSTAYFSLEFGIHESLRLYSGGLGCLAGDHLKSASDRNVPLVGVGLFYRCGYFQQYLNNDGWQQEACVVNELHHMPLRKVCNAQNEQVEITVPLPDGPLRAVVWRLDVGRIPVFLLDANVAENPQAHRNIGTNLYDADRQTRLRQELLLGIGGFHALLAMGFDPKVCHMNEGHAAFVSLARMAHLKNHRGLSLEAAEEVVRRTNVFTTHTPVPAGNETFAADLLRPHLEAMEPELGIKADRIFEWARAPRAGHSAEATMTILALRTADFCNAVSRLHGHVSRRMWAHLWPDCPEDEIPIRHVTNGVHVASWLSVDNTVLLDRYLGPEWRIHPCSPDLLARVDQIPDEALWRAHEFGRFRLIRAARALGERQLSVRNAPRAEIAQIQSILHRDALTIGFARRFAGYKRATLILKDPARLEALLTNADRPVQIVFAGKAHPADDAGKNFIREIIHFARQAAVRHRVVFLENYDIAIARYLVQGVDVWLNTPRRPHEASGTSGMKAAVNGALHVSIPDGWWEEGYDPNCGWAIGHGEEFENHEYQDTVEAQALYNLLENEVVPCFFDRAGGDVPARWVAMMRASIHKALGFFTSHRMLGEYEESFYRPARASHDRLWADNAAQARDLVRQRGRFAALWKQIHVAQPTVDRDISVLHVGEKFTVTARVHLGELQPSEVRVEVYYGPVDSANEIADSHAATMERTADTGEGNHEFRQEVECRATGRCGMTVRVVPRGEEWQRMIPGFITWADGGPS